MVKNNNNRSSGALLRTAIYIRVSTNRQAQHGDSIDEQTQTLTDYVNNRDNLLLYDTYIDDGVSGQKLKRDGFTRLLNDVRTGNIDLIVFTKLDRWFRSLRHYLNTQATLEKYGVNWLAVSQPYYDTSTPQGRAFVSQSMTFAELEAQTDSERILAVLDYKYKRGEVLSGMTPLGYSIVDKHLKPNDDAEKALAIFQHYSRTGSLHDTIRWLESECNIVMGTSNLRKSVLSNKKYIGVFRDNENYCPPIIPRDLFDDVQRKLSLNVKRSQKHTYIFSGLVRCSCCGGAMSGSIYTYSTKKQDKITRLSYKCHRAIPFKRCSNIKAVREHLLEAYLLQNIKPLLQQYIVDYNVKAVSASDQQQKQALLLRKIEKLKDLYINDLITLEEYKTDKAEYTAQLAAFSAAPEPIKDLSGLRSFLTLDIDAVYSSMSPEERRYLWRSIIREIRVDEKGNINIVFL